VPFGDLDNICLCLGVTSPKTSPKWTGIGVFRKQAFSSINDKKKKNPHILKIGRPIDTKSALLQAIHGASWVV